MSPAPILTRVAPLAVLLAALAHGPAAGALPVAEIRLENGFTLLVARRPGLPMVAAAWAVRAGSAAEAPGATGTAHLLEHALFHGTRTIPSASAFARLYTENGVVGINAFTEKDFTVFSALVPRERLELWFWMESDRLREPVLRELERELRVVAAERRQRVDANPAGRLDEAVAAAFWGEHPYGRPTSGLPDDLPRLGRAAAEAFLARHYRPENLVAALVGDLDEAQVRDLARRYFGRLAGESGATGAPHPSPLSRAAGEGDAASAADREGAESAGRRVELACDCAPQARILYPTVPFGHPDTPALDVLAGVLNGRSGRLHRSLVLGQGLAFAAWAEHAPLRRAGSLALRAEARGATSPAALAAALAAEIERLRREPVGEDELAKVKNQITADAYRGLRDPMGLALRLLAYASLGDWRHVDAWAERAAAVAAEDLRRVARLHLAADRATTVLSLRPSPAAGSPGAGAP